ncbi:MAG: hypothetical protein B6U94_08030 [Thermofilum sp. ex4484_79]|nr:MAG: hypothetical protein B6U94_08030 [Thermofilum sp. ex4484_79]
MSPKIKIEDVLPSGEKISIVLEGRDISEKRVIQVLQLLKIMSGEVNNGRSSEPQGERLIDLVLWVIRSKFNDASWFSSKDILSILRDEYNVDVTLNSVSTYLLRLYRRGILERKGGRFDMRYRLRNSGVLKVNA